MKYANFYDLESLTLLNRHEGCACSIKACDVDVYKRQVVYRNGQGNRRAVLLPDLRQGAVPAPVVRPERHQKGKS